MICNERSHLQYEDMFVCKKNCQCTMLFNKLRLVLIPFKSFHHIIWKYLTLIEREENGVVRYKLCLSIDIFLNTSQHVK